MRVHQLGQPTSPPSITRAAISGAKGQPECGNAGLAVEATARLAYAPLLMIFIRAICWESISSVSDEVTRVRARQLEF